MKNYVILTMIIMLVGLASAVNVPLIVSPNSAAITSTANQAYTYTFNIVNPNTMRVLVKTDSTFATMPDFWLNSGENKTVSSIFVFNSSGTYNFRLKGYIEASYTNPDTYTVNMSTFLFPTNINIKNGDTINFYNRLNTSIQVYGLETSIITIPANQQYQKIFNEIKSYSYWTTPNFLNGFVNVEDRNLAHTPEIDTNVSLGVSVNFLSTLMELAYITNSNFTVPLGEARSGNIIIKNVGNNPAYSIKLDGDWLTFSNNNFNLQPGQDKNVEFVVRPYVTSTNETDKTYTKTMKISGNFPDVTKEIIVTVPYAKLSENATQSLEYLKYLHEVYCANSSDTKDSILCTQEAIIEYRYINNLSDTTFNYNMTLEMLKTVFNNVNEFPDTLATSTNVVKQDVNSLRNATDLNSQNLANIKEENSKIQERIDSIVSFGYLASITILSLLIGLILFLLIRHQRVKMGNGAIRRWQ